MIFHQQVKEFQCTYLYAYFENLVRRYATLLFRDIREDSSMEGRQS
jgi:hypothetical protein